MDVIASILNEKYPPLVRFLADPPDALERIVFKCLQKDIEKRYQSFDEVVLDLKELRQQVAPDTRVAKGGAGARLRRYVRRSRKVILALGVLVGLAFLAFYLFRGPSAALTPWDPLAGVPPLLESDFDDQVRSSSRAVLIFAYFYSPDHGAAGEDAWAIGAITKRYGEGLRVLRVDTSINAQFRERFDIGYQPAAMIFVRGVELARLSGAFSEEALVKLIEENYERPLTSGDQSLTSKNRASLAELIESDFTQKVLNSRITVLLFVSPESSVPGPYQSIRSILERIGSNNPDTIKVLWLNTYDNFLLADRLKADDSKPHLLLFKNGKNQRRLDGNVSEEAIVGMLEGYVALK